MDLIQSVRKDITKISEQVARKERLLQNERMRAAENILRAAIHERQRTAYAAFIGRANTTPLADAEKTYQHELGIAHGMELALGLIMQSMKGEEHAPNR